MRVYPPMGEYGRAGVSAAGDRLAAKKIQGSCGLFRGFRKIAWIVLAAGVLLTTGAQAEVFRWVDERGRVHFSDRPKGGGAQKLEIGSGGPGNPDQQRLDTERNKERERMLDAYREEREARQLQRREAEAQERRRSSNCAYARNRLKTYRSSRLYQPLEDGGRRYLDQDERQREIERAEAAERHWCRS